ncbi:hypothetical protein L9F63_014669, partial [Diploptera punctata]
GAQLDKLYMVIFTLSLRRGLTDPAWFFRCEKSLKGQWFYSTFNNERTQKYQILDLFNLIQLSPKFGYGNISFTINNCTFIH